MGKAKKVAKKQSPPRREAGGSPSPKAAAGPKSRGGVIPNQKAIAAAMEVSQKTVSLWLRRPDWPVSKEAPWKPEDLDTIRGWRSKLQEDRAAEAKEEEQKGETELSIALQLKLEQMLKTRVQRELLEGKYVERALLDGALVSLTRVYIQELENIERSLPLQVAGCDPGQVEKIIRDRFRASRQRLTDQKTIELQKAEEAIKAQDKAKPRGRPGVAA